MKSVIGKFLLSGLLSMFALNAYAEWQCYAVDAGGHYWKSTGQTQDRANAVAMNFCTAHSPNGSSCQTDKCLEI